MIPDDVRNKLVLLIVLLPGFVTMSIIGMMVDLGGISDLQLIFYSLVLTFPNLVVAWALTVLLNQFVNSAKFAGRSKEFGVGFAIVLLLTSTGFGVGLGIAAERDVFFRVLRAMPFTTAFNRRSTSRPIAFLLSQNTQGNLDVEGDARIPPFKKTSEAWARIELKTGKIYDGWPEFYETGSNPSEVYLSPACELMEGMTARPLQGPGIIIREDSIVSIALLDRESNDCALHWLRGTPIPKP